MEPNVNAVPTAIETLLGGNEIEVQYVDGRTERVRVRQLPVADYRQAQACFDDELSLVALVCGQVRHWAGQLTPESYEAVAVETRRVNALFFAWLGRQVRAQLDVLPQDLRDTLARGLSSASSPTTPRRTA